jgi:hypothetical protein
MTDNQYDRYFAALRGEKLNLGKLGDPPSGFFRFRRWRTDPPLPFQRTLALWRDAEGGLYASKNYYNANTISYDEADELFTSPDCVAIPFTLYKEIETKGSIAWPEIHTTYLRTKDITAGLHWTEDWSRKQLAANVETHTEIGDRKIPDHPASDRMVNSGDNGAPTDARAYISDRLDRICIDIGRELKEMGGKPNDKLQADRLADYINTFRDIHKDSEHHRRNLKSPLELQLKQIDGDWMPISSKAKEKAEKLKGIAGEWLDKAQVEADAIATAAREQAIANGVADPIEPSSETKVSEKLSIGTGRQVSVRTRTIYAVACVQVFMEYLIDKKIELPSGLMIEMHKLANKLAVNGLTIPGVSKSMEKKAS